MNRRNLPAFAIGNPASSTFEVGLRFEDDPDKLHSDLIGLSDDYSFNNFRKNSLDRLDKSRADDTTNLTSLPVFLPSNSSFQGGEVKITSLK